MKAIVKATLITIGFFMLLIMLGVLINYYPQVACYILVGTSLPLFVIATWKIVYELIDKD